MIAGACLLYLCIVYKEIHVLTIKPSPFGLWKEYVIDFYYMHTNIWKQAGNLMDFSWLHDAIILLLSI